MMMSLLTVSAGPDFSVCADRRHARARLQFSSFPFPDAAAGPSTIPVRAASGGAGVRARQTKASSLFSSGGSGQE
jgi:hypothetical protein